MAARTRGRARTRGSSTRGCLRGKSSRTGGRRIVVAMTDGATPLVRRALSGSGIELVASCEIAAYNERAPAGYRSAALMPSARGLVVAGSAGPTLWRRFCARMEAAPSLWKDPHPYDAYVADLLARADRALTVSGVVFRRFDAALDAPLRMPFLALAQLVGLGSPGPFGLLIHEEHGPWWALRGAWLVDAEVEGATVPTPPCRGCSAPCVGRWASAGGIVHASAEVRARCIVGQAARYDADQIAYHYEREATVGRLCPPSPSK